MAIFQSNALTIVDQTDNRKFEIYIKSNMPTVQIFNQNTGAYSPDWSFGLELTADVYLDSREMESYEKVSFQWSVDDGLSITEVSKNRTYRITNNTLASNPILTYICVASYQNITATSKITFTRVDTGKNGSDGTGVNIKGTATSVTAIPETDYYTITYEGSNISNAQLNDSYLYNGDLYTCVDSRDGVDYFINVGRIQGPAGKDAKTIVLTGSAQVFKISKTNVYTPSTISVIATPINTTITDWTYSVNGGQTFLSTAPAGVVRNGNTITVTGSTLASNSLAIKVSDGTVSDVFTIYKAFDGTDGTPGNPGTPASMAFLTNENISFSADVSGQVALTSFTTNVVAYSGTNKVTPTIRTNTDGTPAITGLPSGMTVASPMISSNEQILTFTIAKDSNLGSALSNNGTITIPITSPVSTNLILSWSKINTGATGVGIESTTVSYGVSDSSSSQPTDWQSTIPAVAEGKYLWTRTIIDYTDEKIPDTVTYIYTKQGTKGDSGTAGSSVTVSSVQYQEGTSATIAPTGTWSNAVVAVADGKYLWTKTAFSDGKTAYGVAKQGANGKDGVGISSITVDYGVSDNASTKPTTWQQSIPVVAEGKYLWTRTITDYTDASVADTVAYVYTKQGIKGETGVAGSSVTVSSIQYQAGTSATTAPTGVWSDSVVAVSEGNYLWTKTTFSDGKVAYGVTKQGQTGNTGAMGMPGTDAVTFQIYSSNGYALSINTPTVTLQTFAYIGDIAITAGATYQWYVYNDSGWTAISGGTNAYLTITREDVAFSKSYMCKMTFNGVEYTSVATIDDKNDENKVFTTKPSNYSAGDLWIVGVDYAPAGVAVGTLLRAEHTNVTYGDVDWVTATKYDKELNDLKDNIETYNQYFSFDSAEGLKISAKDNNGTPSQFSTSLTNERLSFNYGNEAIAYINGTKMNIKEAEIESPLTVTGKYSGSTMLQAPVINIGNFSIIVESNGSLSIVANT